MVQTVACYCADWARLWGWLDLPTCVLGDPITSGQLQIQMWTLLFILITVGRLNCPGTELLRMFSHLPKCSIHISQDASFRANRQQELLNQLWICPVPPLVTFKVTFPWMFTAELCIFLLFKTAVFNATQQKRTWVGANGDRVIVRCRRRWTDFRLGSWAHVFRLFLRDLN